MVPSARRSTNFAPLKFCYHCGQATFGEPLFCNFCGRSYNVKLCPRFHVNSRGTSFCSKCGSHDLSTPQLRVPLWARMLQFALIVISDVFVTVFSAGLVILFAISLSLGSNKWGDCIAICSVLSVLWWSWGKSPVYLRKVIRRLIQNKVESYAGCPDRGKVFSSRP
jgi:hypothetical protein